MTNKTLSDEIIHKEIDTGVFGAIIENDTVEVIALKKHLQEFKEELKAKFPINCKEHHKFNLEIDTLMQKHFGDKLL